MYYILQDERKITPVIVYELKKVVAVSLKNIKPRNLAQVLVEGYYLLQQQDKVVTVLSDVNISHFFCLKKGETSPMEVVWYNSIVLQDYPPKAKNTLYPFLHFNHLVLSVF